MIIRKVAQACLSLLLDGCLGMLNNRKKNTNDVRKRKCPEMHTNCDSFVELIIFLEEEENQSLDRRTVKHSESEHCV